MSFARIRRELRTIGVRMTLGLAAIFGLGAILVSFIAYVLVDRALDEQLREVVGFRFSQFAAEYARGGREAVIERCKDRIGREQKAFFVRLADRTGRTTFLRDADDWNDFNPQALALRQYPAQLSWSELTAPDGTVLSIASKPLADGTLLQVGKTLENYRELLNSFRSSLLFISGFVVLLSIPIGAFFAGRALRPIQLLTGTVRSILSTGKFDARVPPRGTGDEIDELVVHFNTMLLKIDRLVRGMRESLENVAHDLRTPMTRLRNTASKALESDAEKAASHEALADCLEESEYAVAMLTAVMDISEAESGAMKLKRAPVSIHDLAARIVDLYEHVAEEKNVSLTLAVPAGIEVSADSLRLQRAMGNLVDNAIKYTPAGGSVSVTAGRVSGGVQIVVADTGDGIPADEHERIWERLYRVDKSRSERGLGLGLSLVKAIVEAHGGEISVASEPGRGSRFTIRLPA